MISHANNHPLLHTRSPMLLIHVNTIFLLIYEFPVTSVDGCGVDALVATFGDNLLHLGCL